MTMQVPSVSIVIPAYNEEKNLPHILQSLQQQTMKPYEIIVADNNSSDKSASIAKSYGAVVLPVQQQGYVYALSSGMNHAKGDVIAVIDADTIALPTWVESIAMIFADDDIVGVTGAITIKGNQMQAKVLDQLYELFLKIHFLVGLPHLIGFNLAVRRSALEKINGINTKYIMSPDVDLGLRLKKVGRVVYDEKMKVIPSTRRWDDGIMKTFIEYSKGYFYTVWLRRPVQIHQTVIR